MLSSQLEATSADYESYLQSERNYLKSLQMEPIEITQGINYMELLIKLYHLQYVSFWIQIISIKVNLGNNLMKPSRHGIDSIMILFTMVSLVRRLPMFEPGIVPRTLVGLLTVRRSADMKKNTKLKLDGCLILRNIMMRSVCALRENIVGLWISSNSLSCSICLK